jgi:hypothetical protein
LVATNRLLLEDLRTRILRAEIKAALEAEGHGQMNPKKTLD